MKKIAFASLLALSALLMSCSKQSADSVSDYSGIANGAQATDGDTSKMKNPPTPIDISTLPSSISSYISSHYAGASVDKAGKDKDGNYVVVVLKENKPLGLLFDSSGNFKQELPPPPQGGNGKKGGMPPPPQLTEVSVSSLPNSISSYINTTYTGSNIDKAGKDKDGNYVVLVLKDSKPIGLLFDASGKFLKELPPPPKKP